MKCYFCGRKGLTVIAKNHHFSKSGIDVVRCSKCESSYDYPLHNQRALNKFYTKIDFDHRKQLGKKSNGFLRKMVSSFLSSIYLSPMHLKVRARTRMRHIEKLVKNGELNRGSVLEIGPGRAVLMKYLKDAGWKTEGIEINKKLIKHVKDEYNIKLKENVKELNGKKFDLILMFHVIEHMADPIKEVKKLKEYLKPKGMIIIEVPHMPHKLSSWNKEAVDFEFDSVHVFHFREKTFRSLAKKAGMSLYRADKLNHKTIFKNSSIYRLHPEWGRKFSITKFIKSMSNAFYLLILHLSKQDILSKVDGDSELIRVIIK